MQIATKHPGWVSYPIVIIIVSALASLYWWGVNAGAQKLDKITSGAAPAAANSPIPELAPKTVRTGPKFIGGTFANNGIAVMEGNSSAPTSFEGTNFVGNGIAVINLPEGTTQEQVMPVILGLIEKFKNSHKGQAPSADWINKRLKSQGKSFRVKFHAS